MTQTILLVDSRQHALEPLRDALKARGYAPTLVLEGDDPLAVFGAVNHELVFINLACAQAETLCDGIRAHPEGTITPILFLGTGNETVASPADALAVGGDYYFPLPPETDKILAKVETYLGAPKGVSQAPAKSATPKAATVDMDDDLDALISPGASGSKPKASAATGPAKTTPAAVKAPASSGEPSSSAGKASAGVGKASTGAAKTGATPDKAPGGLAARIDAMDLDLDALGPPPPKTPAQPQSYSIDDLDALTIGVPVSATPKGGARAAPSAPMAKSPPAANAGADSLDSVDMDDLVVGAPPAPSATAARGATEAATAGPTGHPADFDPLGDVDALTADPPWAAHPIAAPPPAAPPTTHAPPPPAAGAAAEIDELDALMAPAPAKAPNAPTQHAKGAPPPAKAPSPQATGLDDDLAFAESAAPNAKTATAPHKIGEATPEYDARAESTHESAQALTTAALPDRPAEPRADSGLAQASDAVLAQIAQREAELAQEAQAQQQREQERLAAEAQRLAAAAEAARRDELALQAARAEEEAENAAAMAEAKAAAEQKVRGAVREAEMRAQQETAEQRLRQAEAKRQANEATTQVAQEQRARQKAQAEVRRAEEQARRRAEEEALAAASAMRPAKESAALSARQRAAEAATPGARAAAEASRPGGAAARVAAGGRAGYEGETATAGAAARSAAGGRAGYEGETATAPDDELDALAGTPAARGRRRPDDAPDATAGEGLDAAVRAAAAAVANELDTGAEEEVIPAVPRAARPEVPAENPRAALQNIPTAPAGAPKPLDPSSGQLSGNRDVASLFVDAFEQRITGRIDVSSDQRQKSVFFENGSPVDAYSSQVYDRMEEYLLRHGKITRSQYQEVRGKRLRSARQVGAYLVNEGFLKTEELFAAVRGQLEELYFGLFEWEEAFYSYRPEVTGENDRVFLDLPPRALVVEGIRRKVAMPRLVAAVGSPSSLVGLQPQAPAIVKTLGLLPDEQLAMRLLDGQRTIEDLVFSSGLDAVRVYQLIYALVLTGAAVILVRGLDTLAADPRQSDHIDRARILEKAEQVRFLDYFAMLGVGRGATGYEIERACQEATEAFDPGRFSPDVRQEMGPHLQEIVEILADARHVLGDPERRAAYASHLP